MGDPEAGSLPDSHGRRLPSLKPKGTFPIYKQGATGREIHRKCKQLHPPLVPAAGGPQVPLEPGLWGLFQLGGDFRAGWFQLHCAGVGCGEVAEVSQGGEGSLLLAVFPEGRRRAGSQWMFAEGVDGLC